MPHNSIWKFQLSMVGEQQIEMPGSSEIIAVQMQTGICCMWARVATEMPARARLIRIFGTGHQLPESPGQFIGTVQDGYGLVLHIFDGGEV